MSLTDINWQENTQPSGFCSAEAWFTPPQHLQTTRPLSTEIRGERLARRSLRFLRDVMPQMCFPKRAPGYPVGWMYSADVSATA